MDMPCEIQRRSNIRLPARRQHNFMCYHLSRCSSQRLVSTLHCRRCPSLTCRALRDHVVLQRQSISPTQVVQCVFNQPLFTSCKVSLLHVHHRKQTFTSAVSKVVQVLSCHSKPCVVPQILQRGLLDKNQPQQRLMSSFFPVSRHSSVVSTQHAVSGSSSRVSVHCVCSCFSNECVHLQSR